MRILTSVIIPVYNTAPYLRQCLDSVLAQTQRGVELILVDDGSTDGSYEICQEYAEKASEIRLLRQDHLYQGTARNRGLALARGEYVYFMDSDDWIEPDLFERCYALCEERQLDYLTFDSQEFSDEDASLIDGIYDRAAVPVEEGDYTGPAFWNRYYNDGGMVYVCWLLYLRRSYLLRHDLRYEEHTYYEDNDWTLRVHLNGQHMAYRHWLLHHYRRRRGSNMLSGFTPELLTGCIRMHDALIAVQARYPDAERQRMIADVVRLNLDRFGWLAGVAQPEAHAEVLIPFAAHLKAQSDGGNRYAAELAAGTALRLLSATDGWTETQRVRALRQALRETLGTFYGLGDPKRRVALYGSGLRAEEFLDGYIRRFGEPRAMVTVVDSVKETGAWRGYPVMHVTRLPEIRPDVIILMSRKYEGEMRKAVDGILPGFSRIVTIW